MSNSICCFMPAKEENASLKTVRFVYETEWNTLTQPFVHPIYVIHIVTKGTASLKIEDKIYSLKRGDVFFAFPGFPYYLDGSDDFEYIYISFMGSGVADLLSKCKITPFEAYYSDFEFLCNMFENAVKRVTPSNANMLTESVLYYALSFFGENQEPEEKSRRNSQELFGSIVDYVDSHYREDDMSLSKLAKRFSYTEKYLSSLFKRNMKIGFISYLNNLRIQYSYDLIQNGESNISKIAKECGYNDYSYFSRCFKKSVGKTPTQAIKQASKKQ